MLFFVENVGKGFPPFQPPPFEIHNGTTHYNFSEMASTLGTTIAFAPLVAILECVAIAKAFCKFLTRFLFSSSNISIF